jgi:hypothetical protein
MLVETCLTCGGTLLTRFSRRAEGALFVIHRLFPTCALLVADSDATLPMPETHRGDLL